MKRLELFVYGTLKSDQFNFSRFLEGAYDDLQPAKTRGYLFRLGGRIPIFAPYELVLKHRPELIQQAFRVGCDGWVQGEYFLIKPSYSKNLLENLDRLEGYIPQSPWNTYERSLIDVTLQDKQVKKVFTYATPQNRLHNFNRLIIGGEYIGNCKESEIEIDEFENQNFQG
jgi:gamma-glutamylcyclotransferase (GGCT)/AIG2-like uncharacterized protein YtfP